MTDYPGNIDFFTTKIDQTSDCRAKDVNDLQLAVTAIEQTLGVNVQGQNQGTGWTLANRIGTFINDNGTLKSTVLTSSDIPSASISNSKIFHNDTFEFKSAKIGKHDSTYGYTGSSLTPGLTVGETGILNSDADIITDANFVVAGGIVPKTTSGNNIGTSDLRFKYGYIDTVVGRSTGTESLTVVGTINIKSSGDLTQTSDLAFVANNSQGDTVIQAVLGKKIILNPYTGYDNSVTITSSGDLLVKNINFNGVIPTNTANTIYSSGDSLFWQNSPMDVDCYNFYTKYPYVQNSIQEQLIGFEGDIVSVTTSCVSGSSGTNIRIRKNENDVCTIANVTSTPNKVTTLTNTHVMENYPLQLDVLSVETNVTDLRVQVKIKRN